MGVAPPAFSIKLLVTLVLAVAIAGHFAKLIWDAGALRELEPNPLTGCTSLQSPIGPEDIEYNGQVHLVFVSSSPRPAGPHESGGIYTIDPLDPSAPPKLVTANLPFRFLPHGISVIANENVLRVFAINHADEGSIEIFDWTGSELMHVKTIKDETLMNIHNDLVAVDENTFFITIEQGSTNKFLRTLESYSRFGFGKVLYYDGAKFTKVISSLSYANGIALHPRSKNLYVAEMLGFKVHVYEKNQGQLKKLHEIPLDMGPDNLSFGADGSLWIAGHQNMFKVQNHLKDHGTAAPSRVVRIVNPESAQEKPQLIFTDDGKVISAASTAAVGEDRFYMGAIAMAQLLACPLPR